VTSPDGVPFVALRTLYTTGGGIWPGNGNGEDAPIGILIFGGEDYTRIQLEQTSPFDLEQITLGAVTWECWIYPTSYDGTGGVNDPGTLWSYQNVMGFRIGPTGYGEHAGKILCDLQCQGFGDDARSWTNGKVTLNEWNHVAITWNNNGDRYLRIYINGSESSYFQWKDGEDDPVVSYNVVTIFGHDYLWANGKEGFIGKASWIRISNTVRYGGGFTPPDRCILPAIDANTVGQWIGVDDEGLGAEVRYREVDNQEGTEEYDGDAWSAWEESDCV
jgi:hypothetical protein